MSATSLAAARRNRTSLAAERDTAAELLPRSWLARRKKRLINFPWLALLAIRVENRQVKVVSANADAYSMINFFFFLVALHQA